jgi:hypothetical protein
MFPFKKAKNEKAKKNRRVSGGFKRFVRLS